MLVGKYPSTDDLAAAIYEKLTHPRGKGYTTDELIKAFGFMMRDGVDKKAALKRAMKKVKLIALRNNEIIATPTSDYNNQYMIALPSQAPVVYSGAIQSGLTTAGNRQINDSELEWLDEHTEGLDPQEAALAKGMIDMTKLTDEFLGKARGVLLSTAQDSKRKKREVEKEKQRQVVEAEAAESESVS